MGWEGWSVAANHQSCVGRSVSSSQSVVSILWGGNAGEHLGFGALMTTPSRQPALTARGQTWNPLQPAMPPLPGTVGLAGLLFWAGQTMNALMPNATLALAQTKGTVMRPLSGLGVPRYRRKRHISARDMNALLDYHNHIRASVHPPAANMEYMAGAEDCDLWHILCVPGTYTEPSSFKVWDERLARSAEVWASQCIWAHGPSQLMRYVGQNLSVHSGRYRSVVDLVKSWSEEKRHYLFPAPKDCTPHCPWRCSGPVCSHYTQMVWASSNRLGCAIHTCGSIRVWGSTWRQAVYLVCNYAIKGNWIGEAPYKMGRPCSACPAIYQGSCSSNMCFSRRKSNKLLWF
ncbi:peptidase inhibitor R3HDML isoform X2 [Moschus berezovskii]|uniref:peptidase inhibitor R3HDML isoform X2 n=1 Tax=Moschus berezovskii TaxID=68408 RepID=UPI002444A699|nr:peptidase inhibitor R3HDML isoform X2 [Moschus berezovskii]